MTADSFPGSGFINVTDDRRNRYRAGKLGIVVVATPTDVVTISGATGKRIRILKITLSGAAATASQVIPVQLIFRSAADTGGTSTAGTAVPTDSTMVAASATIAQYTGNPTVGTAVGTVGAASVLFALATAAGTSNWSFDFTERNGPGWVLNSAAETLAVNLNGVTLANATTLNYAIEWIEE